MALSAILRSATFHFASGNALFTGCGMLCLAAIGLLVAPARFRSWRRLITGLGIVLVGGSATPLSIWMPVIWASSGAFATKRPGKGRVVVFLVLTLAVVLMEGATIWRTVPPLPVSAKVAVLGDSLSATESPRRPNWPERFEVLSGGQCAVTNLAHPGATAADAVRQARGIPPEAGAVIVFIGGNDLLAGTRAAEYEWSLDEVLALAAAAGRQLYLVELPLIPLHGSYGRAQRRLARKHGAALISKRVVAGVLSRADSTTDGLHLSEAGSRWLAEEFSRRLRPK